VSVVRVLCGEYGPPRSEALLEFAEQTGAETEVEFFGAESIRGHLHRVVAESPPWDLMELDEVIVADLIRRGLLEPLGRRAHGAGINLDDFPQAAIDRFRASDVVYAIPAAANPNVLIYRADLLEEHGFAVPETWDELKTTARTVQSVLESGGKDRFAGFAGCGLAGYEHNFSVIGSTFFPSWGWHWNRGATIPPLVHEAATVDALTAYAALLNEAGPRHPATLSREDARRLFADGNALCLIDAPDVLVAMQRAEPEGVSSQAAIAMVPMGPSGRPEPGLGSPSYCIPRSSLAKEEAWELLQFLISPAVMLSAAIEGGEVGVPRESVISSNEYMGAYGVEFCRVVQQSRAFARINKPLIPHGWDFGDIVGAAVEAAIAGHQTADEALRVAQAMIDGLTWTL
jgi:ABC-type glycerol-3-phosphate transport system substrate-binding protein